MTEITCADRSASAGLCLSGKHAVSMTEGTKEVQDTKENRKFRKLLAILVLVALFTQQCWISTAFAFDNETVEETTEDL